VHVIRLNQAWRYHLELQETVYHDPQLDDRQWAVIVPRTSKLPYFTQHQTLWLRTHFDMPPNDECAYWWLTFPSKLPDHARLWVNYEEIETESEYDPPRWDITFAIAIGDNVVTLQLTKPVDKDSLWREVACVPYPCEI
jgi:hypothetical protein